MSARTAYDIYKELEKEESSIIYGDNFGEVGKGSWESMFLDVKDGDDK